MKKTNTDTFELFIDKVFELLFADVLQPDAYFNCCSLMPNFKSHYNKLTGNFYDDLERVGKLTLFKLALFGDTNIGDIGGFYFGYDGTLKALINSEPVLCSAIKTVVNDDYFFSLTQSLKLNAAYSKNNVKQLKSYAFENKEELLISKDFMSLGCVRAGQWLESNALEAKKLMLEHIDNLSAKNNLPQLCNKLAEKKVLAKPMKTVLMAFYNEKKKLANCLDTSPLFTVIANDYLHQYFHALFSPSYIDELSVKKSSIGVCLFDINETSSHPERLGLSAFTFALKEKKQELAYALFRSKALFSNNEFSNLVHLSTLQYIPSYTFNDFDRLSNNTFFIINEMFENNENNISKLALCCFRQLFNYWLVFGSDLGHQQLFESALDKEMFVLALSLFDKSGVNINTRSKVTGNTILHLAVECKNFKAVNKVVSNPNCNFNLLDNNSKHILQKSSDPMLLAPIVFHLLHRSNSGVLTLIAQQVTSLISPSFITCNKTQAIELVKLVQELVLSMEGEVI